MGHLILSTAIGGFGAHPGAAGDARLLVSVAHYRRLLTAADTAGLTFVLLDDGRAVVGERPAPQLDPLAVFARLAFETHHIGLAAAVPTTYSEPFHVSRELATLDFVSSGRAAWSVTTTAGDEAAANYGRDRAPSDTERRSRAHEFVAVSRKLWDSWEDNAVIADRERGLYVDPSKLHHIDHVGPHFQVRGPQITYRPPQGHIVVIQDDAGDPAVTPSAHVGDVLLVHQPTPETARAAAEAYRAAAYSAGREIRVLQRVLVILGATASEAQARAAALDAAAGDLHAPNALRLVGTAAETADELERWFHAGAADGFHLLPATIPGDVEAIISQLAPALRERGLLDPNPSGTLREQLGLPRPDSQFADAPSEAFTAY